MKRKELIFPGKPSQTPTMTTETIEIPAVVITSVVTLDGLQDWLTARNPEVIAELRAARREDLAGKFKPWKPRYQPCPTKSK
jgi:hypothetical protein